jgi:hypothetical protein
MQYYIIDNMLETIKFNSNEFKNLLSNYIKNIYFKKSQGKLLSLLEKSNKFKLQEKEAELYLNKEEQLKLHLMPYITS